MSASPFQAVRVDTVVQACPASKDKPVHWLEIELVGEDDRPIPYEEYRVKLPDGEEVRGYLDENGFARLDGIRTPGTCLVCFPRIDQDAWKTVART